MEHTVKRKKSRDSVANYAVDQTLSGMVCLLVARTFLGGSSETGLLSHLKVSVSLIADNNFTCWLTQITVCNARVHTYVVWSLIIYILSRGSLLVLLANL